MLIPAGRFNADLIIFTLSPSSSEFSQSLLCCSTSDIFTKVPSTLRTRAGRTTKKKHYNTVLRPLDPLTY